jgi:hypothetical protein
MSELVASLWTTDNKLKIMPWMEGKDMHEPIASSSRMLHTQ